MKGMDLILFITSSPALDRRRRWVTPALGGTFLPHLTLPSRNAGRLGDTWLAVFTGGCDKRGAKAARGAYVFAPRFSSGPVYCG